MRLTQILRDSARAWSEDRASSMGAALAYYSAFSLAPLLILSVAMAGLFFKPEAVRLAVISQLGTYIGDAGARAVGSLIQAGISSGSGPVAAVLGFVTLVAGATTVLVELQADLDRIWCVPPREIPGWRAEALSRLVSVAIIMGLGFVLLLSMVASTAIAAFADFLEPWIGGSVALVQAANFMLSIGVTTILLAILYTWLPNARIRWRDVWIGAAFTSALLLVGHVAIATYLRYAAIASAYGAAGTFVALLLWLYYSAQIFFFGAEFTAVQAGRRAGAAATSPPRTIGPPP